MQLEEILLAAFFFDMPKVILKHREHGEKKGEKRRNVIHSFFSLFFSVFSVFKKSNRNFFSTFKIDFILPPIIS